MEADSHGTSYSASSNTSDMSSFEYASGESKLEHSISTFEFLNPPDGVFQDEYFRNNKSHGVKNIQCFPKCASLEEKQSVHKVGKSCAGPIIVKLNDSVQAKIKYYVFGRVTEKQDENSKETVNTENSSDSNAFDSLFKIGEKTLEAFVKKNQYRKENRYGQLYCGERLDRPDYKDPCFTFHPRTWHYSWRGGRYRKSFHGFQVSLCRFNEEKKEYTCIANHISQGFRVLSNRTLKNRNKSKKIAKTLDTTVIGTDTEKKHLKSTMSKSKTRMKRRKKGDEYFPKPQKKKAKTPNSAKPNYITAGEFEMFSPLDSTTDPFTDANLAQLPFQRFPQVQFSNDRYMNSLSGKTTVYNAVHDEAMNACPNQSKNFSPGASRFYSPPSEGNWVVPTDHDHVNVEYFKDFADEVSPPMFSNVESSQQKADAGMNQWYAATCRQPEPGLFNQAQQDSVGELWPQL
mmetsp:Transcript_1787/g.2104  ORF Transcript_1787/g.2104 Transcript_1787/m.2104 type:complete len:459 (+) Transcript_1787:395-1771(+)|eukprot:CAMPEP_0184019968 /NCGR_PEP_ID=MMETSP0954-20121128/9075_1 /TAXON_ID=627963 /ORGANISM="Aplanochytrium sp, Strain PBS07" /LENGTH=458 /DNA_ID=CAMNT_0026301751 /DNA_START=377 /DNA_END=1753 /DNA_ORIENTATION=-